MLTEYRGNGPADGPYPIQSILAAPAGGDEDSDAGKVHCRRGIEAIKEHGGILDLLSFIQDCLEDFPDKVQAAKNSEEEAVEMEESRLDIHQALQKAESLLQEIGWRVDKTAGQ